MFLKKFLVGSIVGLSLIAGVQSVACAEKIKVAVENNYYQRHIVLREGNHIIFSRFIPTHYLHTYYVDQLNGMEIEDDQAINDIHQAIDRSGSAMFTYYASMEPGSALNLTDSTRIFAEHTDSLKDLLMYLNSAKK